MSDYGNNKPPKATFKSLHFGLVSAKEAKAVSVSEITIGKTFVKEPKQGSLNDLLLGPGDESKSCNTCSQEIGVCNGHPGHAVLAHPVVNPQCINYLVKIIRCVCLSCSRFISKEIKYTDNKTRSRHEIFKDVTSVTSPVAGRICGLKYIDGRDDLTPEMIEQNKGCGFVNPLYRKEGVDIAIRASTAIGISCMRELGGFLIESSLKDVSKKVKKSVVVSSRITGILDTRFIHRVLSRISPEDLLKMGFGSRMSHPSSIVMTVLTIPSTVIRPNSSMMACDSSDEMTIGLKRMFRDNNNLLDYDFPDRHKSREPVKKRRRRTTVITPVTESKKAPLDVTHVETFVGTRIPFQEHMSAERWNLVKLLNCRVATYLQNEIPGVRTALQRSGRPAKSVRSRIGKKDGRFRKDIAGKRVDFSARCVVGPNPGRNIDEMGVPEMIAKTHTIPVRVTVYNRNKLTMLVRRGANRHPGARLVEKLDGTQIDLKFKDGHTIVLKLGWVVWRYMHDGDTVLASRQPCLHRVSIMAHVAKIIRGNMLRLALPATSPYNADFDGDEMNLHTVHELPVIAEAKELMLVRKQILSVADGTVVMYPVQDAVYGCWLLSKPDTVLTRDEYSEVLSVFPLRMLNDPRFPKGDTCTGSDVISLLFPKTFNFQDDGCVFHRGRHVSGYLTKKILIKLTFVLAKDYSCDICADFLMYSQNICDAFLMIHGSSIKTEDCCLTPEVERIKKKIIRMVREVSDQITPTPEKEKELCDLMDQLRERITLIAIDSLDNKQNHFLGLVQSGAKGGTVNLSQMLAMVGQTYVENERTSGDTIPYLKHIGGVKRKGMIMNSFSGGLDPVEFFSHTQGSREGLIDTNVRTSDVGYKMRKQVKALSNVVVGETGIVHDTENKFYEEKYGGDMIDSTHVEHIALPYIGWSAEQMDEVYGHGNRDEDVDNWEINMLIDDWKYFTDKANFDNFGFFTLEMTQKTSAVTCFSPHRVKLDIDCFNQDDDPNHENIATLEDASRELKKLLLINRDCKAILEHGDVCRSATSAHILSVFSSHRMVHEYKWTLKSIKKALNFITQMVIKSRIDSGSTVGTRSGQSFGNMLVQTTLDGHRTAGNLMQLKMGLPRCHELVNHSKKGNIKTPTMVMELIDPADANLILCNWPERSLSDICSGVRTLITSCLHSDGMPPSMKFMMLSAEAEIYIEDGEDGQEGTEGFPEYGLKFELKRKVCSDSGILITNIADELSKKYSLTWADPSSFSIFMFPRKSELAWIRAECIKRLGPFATNTEQMFHHLTSELLCKRITGVPGITSAHIEKHNGKTYIRTIGSNLLEALLCDYVNPKTIYTNHVHEIMEVFGIEAARRSLANEYRAVLRFSGAFISFRHLWLIATCQAYTGIVLPVTRHGVLGNFDSVLSKCFETPADVMMRAGIFEETEKLNGITENALVGNIPPMGTRKCDLLTDVPFQQKLLSEIDQDLNIDTLWDTQYVEDIPVTTFKWKRYPEISTNTDDMVTIKCNKQQAGRSSSSSSLSSSLSRRTRPHIPLSPSKYSFNSGDSMTSFSSVPSFVPSSPTMEFGVG